MVRNAKGVSRILTEPQLSTLLGVLTTFCSVPFGQRDLRADEAAIHEQLWEKLLAVREPMYGVWSPGTASASFTPAELALLDEILAASIEAFRDDEVSITIHLGARRIEDVEALHALVADALAEASNAPRDFA